MINFFSKYKFIFYLSNLIFIIFYLFPGSLLGCFLYNDCYRQPQITADFIISSNHLYAFFLLSIVGFFTYRNSHQLSLLNKYLVLIAIFLEILHVFIPNRSFELADLFGNLIGVLISACSSIPSNTSNSCSIFNEKYLWFKHVRKSEKKWGTPIHLQLAIIKMESDFDWLAKPPRQKLFKIIPYKRPSSSFGYSQAVDGTWKQYKKETGNKMAVRNRFKDSVDFIGWYTNKSSNILKISKTDVFRQYVAYHEGWGNYKHYKKNKKIINLAKKVERQSNLYKKQLLECQSELNKNKYIIF